MVVKGSDPFHSQAPHHDERNGVAEGIRLVRVLPEQLDGRAAVILTFILTLPRLDRFVGLIPFPINNR